MISSLPSILRRMLSRAVCFLPLAALLIPADALCEDAKEVRVKQNALAIPLDWPVQVNLKNREVLHGRMGRISDEGFVLQYLNAGKIEERTIVFANVKRIYGSNGVGPTTKKTLLVPIITYLAVFGLVFGLLSI